MATSNHFSRGLAAAVLALVLAAIALVLVGLQAE
jgi:hypothetical protein